MFLQSGFSVVTYTCELNSASWSPRMEFTYLFFYNSFTMNGFRRAYPWCSDSNLTTSVFTVYCRAARCVLHLCQPNGEGHLLLFSLWHHFHYIILLLNIFKWLLFSERWIWNVDWHLLLSNRISCHLYTFWQYSHMQGRTLDVSDPFLHVPVPEPSLMTFFPSGKFSWSPRT